MKGITEDYRDGLRDIESKKTKRDRERAKERRKSRVKSQCTVVTKNATESQ